MKNIICLAIGIVLVSSALADDQNCTKAVITKDKFDSLVDVTESNVEEKCKTLEIDDSLLISSIAANAFNNLEIDHLIINNRYKELSLTKESFNGLPKLKILDINTPIKALNYETLFQSVPDLTHLALSINTSIGIMEETLPTLPELTTLKIFDYNSWTIDYNTFINAPKSLNQLSLSLNSIEVIKKNSFSSLEQLDKLEIQYNTLDSLEAGCFNGLKINQILDLSYNELKIVKKETFEGLVVELLDLSDNRNLIIENDAFLNSKITNLYLCHTGINSIDDKTKAAWGLSTETKTFFKLDCRK